MSAAARQVRAPTQAITSLAIGATTRSGKTRASIYTPAATIVAA